MMAQPGKVLGASELMQEESAELNASEPGT